MAHLHSELERMNAENQKLKGMLTQVTNNYSTLQMHIAMMQQQRNSTSLASEERKNQTTLRKVLEQPNSPSEERTLSGSPPHKNKRIDREDSPESAGWAQKVKVSKLNPDQSAEATMRKARVSVRARSEAPMVSN